MSENWIYLIPEDPTFAPDVARQLRARDRFAEIAPRADEVSISVTEAVEFVNCAGNFERVRCPSCGSVLGRWWQDRMDEDDQGRDDGFKLASYATPCCGATCTLHELVYDWPQGFARFYP
jgi:hypothetical protein